MKKVFLYILGCISFWIGFSCSEDLKGEAPGTEEEQEITLSFTLAADAIQTRGMSHLNSNENQIEELDVLIFHQDALYERQTFPFHGNTGSISVKTVATTEEVTIWIIANSHTAISAAGLGKGSTREEVKKSLTAEFTSTGTVNGLFPMWGESVFLNGISQQSVQTETTDVSLIRALAKINVKIDDAVVLPSGVMDFKLLSIQVFQANDRIQIVPDHLGDGTEANKYKVFTPSIPETAVADITTETILSGDGKKAGSLYIPESLDAATMYEENATWIIVEALYDTNQQSSYYRLDLKDDSGTPLPFLRNKNYTLNIKEVTGAGSTDPDGAMPYDLVASVLVWDELEIGGTEDYMTIDSRVIDLHFYKNSTKALSVQSDLNLYTVQFCNQDGDLLPGTQPGELIVSDRFRVEIEDDGKTIRASARENNEDDTVHTEYVRVTSGNIQFLVTINQGTRKMRDYVTIFNITGLHGNLGDEVVNIDISFENNPLRVYGRGLQEILKNENNFGWEGTVPFEGFIIAGLPFQTKFVPALLDMFNVVYMPVVSENTSETANAVSKEEAEYIVNWLEEDESRILVIQSDLGSNRMILDYLGININSYRPLATTQYIFPDHAPHAIINGPFGVLKDPMYTAGPGNQAYISTVEHPEITPVIVNSTDETQMVVGIDMERRIVLCSTMWLHTRVVDGGVLTGNGTINNGYDRMIANIWAWIAETVLGDEHDPDITL
ncbi:MAG: fimbrial protein [Bacteroides sp.]|nr:fimbrial protein [Bacteroides sp.]